MKSSPTLTEIQHAVATQGYGANAKPVLHADKSIEGLIRANCQRKSRVLAREIIRQFIP